MVNLQKVNPLKTPNIAFWLFYAQVDFLASWLFGGWPFLLVSKIKSYYRFISSHSSFLYAEIVKHRGAYFKMHSYISNES